MKVSDKEVVIEHVSDRQEEFYREIFKLCRLSIILTFIHVEIMPFLREILDVIRKGAV